MILLGLILFGMFCVGEDFKCCGSYIFACEGDDDYEVDGGEFCVCGKFLPVYRKLIIAKRFGYSCTRRRGECFYIMRTDDKLKSSRTTSPRVKNL